MHKNIKYSMALIIILGSSSAFCSDFSEKDLAIATALRRTPLAEICNGNGKDKTYPILLTVLQYYDPDIGYQNIDTFEKIYQVCALKNENDTVSPLLFNRLMYFFSTKYLGNPNFITWELPKNYTFKVVEFYKIKMPQEGGGCAYSLCGNARLKVQFDSKRSKNFTIVLDERIIPDQKYGHLCNLLFSGLSTSPSTPNSNCIIL